MPSVIPFAFNAVELYVVTVNGKHWTRAKEVNYVPVNMPLVRLGTLEYQRRTKDILRGHVSIENKRHRFELQDGSVTELPLEWPKNSQPDEYYLNEVGMYEVLFGSQQPLAKKFRKHCCNVMFPHIRKQLVDKMQEDHQKAIEERDTCIQAIEYENVGLQGEIRNAKRTITDLIENRHAFYMMRCQKRRKGFLMARLKKENPYMSEKGTCEDPNAVHRWCGFKEDVLGEDKYYRNHFSLDATTKREFEELFGIYMD